MNKAVIVNVYKHKIVHKNIKHKLKKQVIFSVSVFCFLLSILTYAKIFLDNSVSDIFGQATKVFNPISELYSEENGGVFVGGNAYFILTKDLEFSLPVRSGEYVINNGEISFTIKESIMIYAAESGIITECGESNFGTKYIKLMHNENIYSVVDNVAVIGCNVGDVVKKGREIAIGNTGDVIKFSVFKDGIMQTNLKVNKNIIEWN